MLLTKKNKLTLGELCIKEELANTDGITLLKLNLKCPEIQCKKRESLAVFAKGFYEKLINSFAEYAKSELFKLAETAYLSAPEDFVPYSALMRYSITRFDGQFLSVVTDISVSDGKGTPSCERKTQVWERSYGTKCRYYYFIGKKELDAWLEETLPNEPKKHIDRDLFALTENGMELYLMRGNEYLAVNVPSEKFTYKF